MIYNLLKNIKYGKIYGAVEHQMSEGAEQLAVLLLKKQRNKFDVEVKTYCKTIEQVSKTVNHKQHLYLILNNSQVLSKTLAKELDEQKALQMSFPNIKADDFYYEIVQLNEFTHISVCRKEYVHLLINNYRHYSLSIVGFSLGNNSAVSLVPFLQSNHLITSNAILTIKGKQLNSIDQHTVVKRTILSINGLEITNYYTLPLASIIAYYSDNFNTNRNFESYNNKILKAFINRRIFKLSLIFGLGLLFVSLLLNFLLFDYYRGKVGILGQKSKINEVYRNELQLLNKELNSKKKLINVIANSASSKTSLYIDEISSTVPKSILLESMIFQPIATNIEQNKKVVFNEKLIFISGIAEVNQSLSNWIIKLEKLEWVDSVEIMHYGMGNNITPSFELKIGLK